jgi:hypothetical protein
MVAIDLQKGGGARTRLVVLLHAYTHTPERLGRVREVVRAQWPDADILVPRLPFGLMSMADPVEVTARLLKRIEDQWTARKAEPDGAPYSAITFVGHSLGALVARKAYVFACGATGRAPFEAALGRTFPRNWEEPLEWVDRVDRIVLLAGMNRGWSVSHHSSLSTAIRWWMGSLVANALTTVSGRRPLILHIRRGAPFITQLRIQWLRMRQGATSGGRGGAQVVQLLGTVDDMVSPDDNLDLVAGRDFCYLEVPKSGHSTVIEMDQSRAGLMRGAVLTRALSAPLGPGSLPADPDASPGRVRPEVTDVVFVIHGIRDLGYWTRKIGQRVKALGTAAGRVFETETSTYGYFPMLPFLLPSQRRRRVDWLMDQYTECVARFPNARFSFVGHSNGTYLLARAVQDHPCCEFEQVVFAGSVVRRGFDWASAIRRGQIRQVLNYVATSDWVVALFPKLFEVVRVQDLGSAGHDGFDGAVDVAERGPSASPVMQLAYIRGAHSAALVEDNWDAIAAFIVNRSPSIPPGELLAGYRSRLLAALSALTPLLWVLLVLGVVVIGFLLVSRFDAEWAGTLAAVGYALLVWKFLTRF